MNDQNGSRFAAFASLHWYDETIKFVFNFVTKTSELLLAIGVVISTANFLTDGDVMRGHQGLSDAWAWAQAIAIDSSLGIVFMNAFQAVREREKIKAIIFFTLTLLLAVVAGLITHFDAYSHAAGLPVTDTRISGIIPLWVMTALRAVAVIGFLLSSRLKHVSFTALRQRWKQEGQPEPAIQQIDYDALARAIVRATQQNEALRPVNVVEEGIPVLSSAVAEIGNGLEQQTEGSSESKSEAGTVESARQVRQYNNAQSESAEMKIVQAYEAIRAEREAQQEGKPISARELAKRANVRRSTCMEWMQRREGNRK